MKSAIRLLASIICLLLVGFLLGCSETDPNPASISDLEMWEGIYRFGEGLDSKESADYELQIYAKNNQYYAQITVNGWLIGLKGIAKVTGTQEEIDIVFLGYPPDGGTTLTHRWDIQDGSVLLRLAQPESALLTEWVTMKPLFEELDDPIGVFFEKTLE